MEMGDFKKAFPKLAHRLGDGNCGLLATLMQERDVPTGTALVEGHTPTESLFLVIEGQFCVEVPRPDQAIEIDRIGPGQWIGEGSLFSHDHTPISRVVALSPSRVLELKHAQFWSAQTDKPDLAGALTREFIDHMSERVRVADALITRHRGGRNSPPSDPLSQV